MTIKGCPIFRHDEVPVILFRRQKAYCNQKHTSPLVYHILTLKATPCDAYTKYSESHYGVVLDKYVTKMHDTRQLLKKILFKLATLDMTKNVLVPRSMGAH